jgi:hypothetical protein
MPARTGRHRVFFYSERKKKHGIIATLPGTVTWAECLSGRFPHHLLSDRRDKKMAVSDVAQSLVEMCRAGKFDEAYDALFAKDARSVEGTGDVAAGLDAVKAKGDAWNAENEVRSITIDGPFVGGDQFAVCFSLEIARRANGEQMTFNEVGIYTVGSDGKITEERFLYGA